MGEKVNPSSSWESLILNEDRTRKSDYLESDKGKEELSIEETFDEWVEELDDMVKEGKISREEAKAQQEDLLKSAVEGIETVRSEEYERQRQEKIQALANLLNTRVNSEQAKLEKELADLDAELGPDDDDLDAEIARLEAEEAELNAELSDEDLDAEIAKLEAEEAKLNAELGDEEPAGEPAEGPTEDPKAPKLVAINADFTKDKDELARDLAEIDLNDEIAKSKFLKKLWKGTLFKKYYHQKYTREYNEGKRTQNIDGEELNVYQIIDRRKEGAIERFVLSVTEGEESYIHKKAGEDLVEADAETTAKLKAAIEKFASAPEDADEEKLKREFENDVGRLKAEARDKGRKVEGSFIDNYLTVAIQAREYARQHIAMDRVVEGFKVYNAKVRDGVRTEAHRDLIDRVVNGFESSKLGRFVPAEVVAGAASIVWALTQTGTRAAAGAAGGIAVSGVFAGLKERNRVTEDRARMFRDVANGMNYTNGRKTKTDKYETEIFGTHYDIKRARDLTEHIKYAMSVEKESGHTDDILEAIAAARVRIDFSDEAGKDLIAYSSEDRRGQERLDLDIALIKAEKSLSEEDRAKLEELKKRVQKEVTEDVDKNDAKFRKTRATMALKKTGKTIGFGLATFFVSQEVIAAIDPNKIGIFEKAGLIKTENSKTASETLLASGFGLNRGKIIKTEIVDEVQLRSDQKVEIDRLGEGYTRETIKDSWTEIPDTPNSVQEVSPADLSDRLRVKYDGWANNGTAAADGNELRAYLTDGQMVSGMRGVSTMGNQSFDYAELAAAGKIKGYITIGGTKFELASKLNEAGQLTWGGGGVFTTTAGETIKAIGDNGEKLYKYFEIAMDNGVDADGVQHIIPFATDAGRDTFNGVIQKAVTVPIEHPALYKFTKTVTSEIPRAITSTGATAGAGAAFAAANLSPRTNLAAPRPVESVEFQNEIRIDADGLGQKFTEFITEPNIQSSAAYSEGRTATYAKWWEEQDEEKRKKTAEVLKKMRGSADWLRSNWGSSFMTWMQRNHPEELVA